MGVLAALWSPLEAWMGGMMTTVVGITDKLSFVDTSASGQSHTVPSAVLWVAMVALGLIVASQIIRFVEFCCFKLKI
jgi:hypothetical protein